MAKKYIFICDNTVGGINACIFADLLNSEEIENLEIKKKEIKNPFLKMLRAVHLSYKISKLVELPMKWIWYDIKKLNINKNDEYNIIVTTDAIWKYDLYPFKKLAKFKNVKLSLIILDTIGVNTPTGRLLNKLYKDKMWDYIFSYDINDSEKYGFIYLEEHYYSNPITENNSSVEESLEKSDAYFIGALKPGRTDEIIGLFEYLDKNGVNAKFDVAKNDGLNIEYEKNGFNILKGRKTYTDVINETKNTNCIIEILQTGQKGQSLRYFEAVCLNKKLLTNNKYIKHLSFYNEKYMKVFEKLEDIDTEWVKEKEEINYNYNNEFSPIHIIEKIKELEQK